MIKAIFFDFDGVLTTDATGTTSIMNYIEKSTNIDRHLFEKAYRKHNWDLLYGNKNHIEVWPQICEETCTSIDIKVLYNSFIDTPIDQEMVKMAKDLKNQGYIVGIITDNKKDRIVKIFEYNKFGFSFDKIVISAEVGSGKKEKEIFRAALEDIPVIYNECVFIDNNRNNLIIPAQKGMNTIFFDHEIRDIENLKKDLQKLGLKFNGNVAFQ
jgi:putative hydrolase of the HAD superfamily